MSDKEKQEEAAAPPPPEPMNQSSLDKHFSQDVEKLAHVERMSTLKAIAKDQAAVEKILEAEKRSPRNSPAPPQLQRMEHSMSQEELKKLDSKAREQAAALQKLKDAPAKAEGE